MIKVLIVEDEFLASQRLESLLMELSLDIEVVEKTTGVKDSIEFLKNNDIDLMFLDINLSDGYSFDIFENKSFKTPPIIFTTAYSEYAIKAFQLNSISYLLKPIKLEELRQAVEKYIHFINTPLKQHKEIDYKALFKNVLKPFKERFLVKLNKSLETIDVEDISYFYTEDKLTFIMLNTGRSVPIDYTLKQLESELNPDNFYRINRKYLVHLKSITSMYYTSKSKIKIELFPENTSDKDLIFVAIEKVGQFKKWLSK